MKFEYYHQGNQLTGLLGGSSGQLGWRWRLRAANGEPIASGEAYRNEADCLHAIALVQSTNHMTPVVKVAS